MWLILHSDKTAAIRLPTHLKGHRGLTKCQRAAERRVAQLFQAEETATRQALFRGTQEATQNSGTPKIHVVVTNYIFVNCAELQSTTPSDPTAVVPPQDGPPSTPSQSHIPPHSATLCIPSPPISLHDGRRRNIQSVPELEENLTLIINSKFIDLPPSSPPIPSPISCIARGRFR